MKFKSDFVTNSSSTSFIINSMATFKLNGKTKNIYKEGRDTSTVDMLKMIEGELIYNLKINYPLDLYYTQSVEDVMGDGWDGGDYQFAGKGWIFCGQTDILEQVMNKDIRRIRFDGTKIKIPQQWIKEDDEKYIKRRYDIK